VFFIAFSTENANVDVGINMKTVMKNEKERVYMSKITINLIIKDFESHFENNHSDQFREIIQNFVGNNQK